MTNNDHTTASDMESVWWADSPSFASVLPHMTRVAAVTALAAAACWTPWWHSPLVAVAVIVIGTAVAMASLWPLACTTYTATTQRLVIQRGVFGAHTKSLEMYRIQDVDADSAWWERLLGIGTITVLSSDAYHPRWVLRGVHRPAAIRADLTTRAAASRQARGVREVTLGR